MSAHGNTFHENAEATQDRVPLSLIARKWILIFALTTLPLVILGMLLRSLHADGSPGNVGLAPLSSVRVPEPPNLADFVQNKTAAVQLGKALYWDMQTGSDGVQACATCHFAGSADSRLKSSLNPGADGKFQILPGPGSTLTADNFPFHKLKDPNDARSQVLSDSDDIVGSQGVVRRDFGDIVPGSQIDRCTHKADPTFNVRGTNTRQVDSRNTPSVINAAFNFHNFWDGRANNVFNGVSPFGLNDPSARIVKVVNGRLQSVAVTIPNASLASQAVAPPIDDVEMSCNGRNFPQLGKKMLNLKPLGTQHVSRTDSTLGSLVSPTGVGLNRTYGGMIRAAFKPEYWNSATRVTVGGQQYTATQANFSLFWGLSIQLYENTLISSQTPFDQFLAGDTSALTARQQAGASVFEGQGKCTSCHDGPLLTNATQSGGGGFAGFFNTGIRPTAEDLGAANTLQNPGFNAKFKTPGLRNVALTAPYFHNGDQLTLAQVVDFYNRGGDFATSGVQIKPLGLTAAQKVALVDFMKSLTDPRVPASRAPFDHPELRVPNGPILPAVGATGR